MRGLIGATVEPTYAEGRAGDVRDSQADISKARRLLGYEPIVDFEEGLRRTVEWYRSETAPAEGLRGPHSMRPRPFVAGFAAALALLALPVSSRSAAPADRIWFLPGPGTLDYLRLFENPDDWPHARQIMSVFKFYQQHTQMPADRDRRAGYV